MTRSGWGRKGLAAAVAAVAVTWSAGAGGETSPVAVPMAPASAPTPPPSCQTMASRLTRAQQVGQLYMMSVQGSSIGPQESAHLHDLQIGSVVLLGTPAIGTSGVRQLTSSIVAAGGGSIPVIVAADQEGGLVQRLQGSGFSTIPQATVQATWSPGALASNWRTYGSQMRGAGVLMNLAPVTDLVTAADVSTNAPIGQLYRNYGTTTTSVATSVTAVITGLRQAPVASTSKHFPGLGAVTTNTDYGVATDTTTTSTSPSIQGFSAAARAGVSSIMVSSAIYQKIDANVPAVFSSRIITGLLRDQLHYSGVVISDDLGNAKSVASVPAAQRGTRFLLAGGDIAMDADPLTIQAMVTDTLSRAASDPTFAASLTARVARVLALKASVGLVRCTVPGGFTPLAPSRVLDTRRGNGATGPVGPNATVHVQIAGRGGVPSSGVSAVVLTITETDATGSGYITVYPDGTSKPVASNLNYPTGDTRANLAVVKLGSNGKVAVTNSSLTTVQLVADVSGYYLAGTAGAPGTFVPLNPARVLDTRTGNGARGPVGAGATVHVQVTGRAGVPSAGVSAVVLNVTETDAAGSGYVTVYPDGTSRPVARNLNYPKGDTRAILVVVKPGADGRIAFTNGGGSSVQLVADVSGYFLTGAATAPGAFVPLNPAQVLDTRFNTAAPGPVGPNGTVHVQVAGRAGVPGSGASAVVLNVTVKEAAGWGFVTVYPDGTAEPVASNLNYARGDTRANLVVVQLGSDGKVALTNNSGTTVQLVADVFGYYR
ncbi:MAG TPA: glycoside hydrolase family 3 N-terminal domain-containing protein [Propionibacteriaceae bacterium]|nr:glycoside hydrolase family 3 N-terminal domain-containing protein [Propionibacteriaceae bacterium]